MIVPPKPPARADRVSLWRYLRLFRRDILSAQPARLYRARMAEFRTPFFRSYLVNEPDLWRLVLTGRPQDFPKSNRIRAGLEPLLGQSVFVTNGAQWARQRRIIDPAFEGGRLRDTFAAMLAAGQAAADRLPAGEVEIEQQMSHAAADVICRTLFSMPIEDETAAAVFHAFRAHQQTQPILNLAAFLPLPRWFPRLHRRRTLATARHIRALITDLQDRLAAEAARVLGDTPEFGAINGLKLARDTFREALRLYPPVPMMVRETTQPECFRNRPVAPGAQIVVSPWHLGRHDRIWDEPDAFCPARWQTDAGRASARDGFIPFSTGPRVCPGAGFAMIEGPLLLALILRAHRVAPVPGATPEPVAHLTVRARHGIRLRVTPRS